MIPDKTLLLDVGGTFLKCSDGRSIPMDSDGSREKIAGALREAVSGYTRLRAAVPGPFDYATGKFLMKHKFAAVYGEYFADIAGLPRESCKFTHDVNCMLLGEIREDSANTAMIALGTGLGFALYVDGKILKNALGSPQVSIFNLPFKDGVLEDYASKRGVYRLYGRDDLTVKEIGARAAAGEDAAQEAFAQMGSIIAQNIAPILEEYAVQELLLGGQISRNWKFFAPAMQEILPLVKIQPVSDFDNATFNGLSAI